MLHKIKCGLLFVFLTLALFACHSVHKYVTPMEANTEFPVLKPEFMPELPAVDLAWTTPLIDLIETEIYPYPMVNITEDFCDRDINHINSPDPKLFAESDRMYIDLMRLQKGDYSFPLPGAKVISPFGGRRKGHTGIDLKTFAGDTIRAAFDGIVRMAKEYSAYGNVIVVRHFNGLETVYSHNSKHLIKQGIRVKAGQPIALVGRTGRATTDHLHFEARIGGRAFNPELLFDMDAQCLTDNVLLCTKNKNVIQVAPMQRLSFEVHQYR